MTHDHLTSPDDLEELFNATLVGTYDDDGPWKAIRRLHRLADHTVFEKARSWCTSSDPRKRARAANVLCQLQSPKPVPQGHAGSPNDPVFVAEATSLLLRMIQVETEEQSLASELIGLGHLGREEALPTLVRYISDPSPSIRFAATWSLASFPNHPQAIDALVPLCDDEDEDIRNYALFGLGTQSDADSLVLREIFARRLTDTSEVVRQEALAGLAKRRDTRAVLPLLHLLKAGSYFVHHESNFQVLLDMPAPEKGWEVDTLMEALYFRFPDLPTRDHPSEPGMVP